MSQYGPPPPPQTYAGGPYQTYPGPAGPAPAPGQPYYPPMIVPNWAALPPHPSATTVLVLGILGLVLSGILSPVAWWMGNSALKDVAAGHYSSNDQLKVGRILGIVGTVILIVAVVCIVIAVFAAFIFAANVPR